MIDVLVPVLDRPHRAAPLAASLRESAGAVPYRLVWVCSPHDPVQEHAARATLDSAGDGEVPGAVIVVPFEPGPGDYARKVNYAYRDTAGWSSFEFVFTGADDLDFRPGWAEACLEAAETGAGVVGTNDLANPRVKRGLHSTHSLVSRAYVEECGATFDETPGVLLFEGYDHQYVDTELVYVADGRGCFAFAAGARVVHLHPFYNRSVPKDATYEKALRQGQADRKRYEQRRKAWEAS
jgi:hypothetical protein